MQDFDDDKRVNKQSEDQFLAKQGPKLAYQVLRGFARKLP